MLIFQIKRLARRFYVDQTKLVEFTKNCNIGELNMFRELDGDIMTNLRKNTNVIKVSEEEWTRRFWI